MRISGQAIPIRHFAGEYTKDISGDYLAIRQRLIGRVQLFLFLLLLGIAGICHSADTRDILTPSERAWLKAHPLIVLGAAKGWEPDIIQDQDGHLRGFIVDHMALLNRKLNTNIQFEVGPWEAMLEKAKRREIEGLTLTVPLDERKPHFSFTDEFIKLDDFIYLRTDRLGTVPTQIEFGSFRGKRVGFLKGVLREQRLLQKYPDITAVPLDTYAELANALLAGDIDAAMASHALEYWRRASGREGFSLAQPIPEAETRMVMSIRKDYPELVTILNKGLATLSTNDLVPLYQRWYGTQYLTRAGMQPLVMTLEEQNWLAAHPVIRVGIDPHWAPLEFRDSAGQPQGISVSYLNRIATRLGVRFEIDTSTTWPAAMRKLTSKEIDILPATAANAERRRVMRFTQPYLSIPTGIFSSAKVAYLGGMESLKAKKIVVVEGEAVHEWLQSAWSELDVMTAANTQKALELVDQGKAFAFIGNLVTTNYYIGQSGLKSVKLVGETPFSYHLSMAIRDDWTLLPGILQKALDAMPAHERERIYQEGISLGYSVHDDTPYWIAIGAIATLLIIVLAERSIRMKRSNTRLKSLARELASVEEHERRQLATKLHDSPMQKLALAQLQFSAITDSTTVPHENIANGLDLMHEALDELHTLQFELSPPVLYRDGLTAALAWLASHISERFGIALTFEDQSQSDRIPDDHAVLLFQCARELVYNIAKHAKSASGNITLSVEKSHLVITVSDDGIGFQGANESERVHGGFGLFSIRERLGLIDGHLDIQTSSTGTFVRIRMPLSKLT